MFAALALHRPSLPFHSLPGRSIAIFLFFFSYLLLFLFLQIFLFFFFFLISFYSYSFIFLFGNSGFGVFLLKFFFNNQNRRSVLELGRFLLGFTEFFSIFFHCFLRDCGDFARRLQGFSEFEWVLLGF